MTVVGYSLCRVGALATNSVRDSCFEVWLLLTTIALSSIAVEFAVEIIVENEPEIVFKIFIEHFLFLLILYNSNKLGRQLQ